jgi:hypothetical protein
VLKRLAFVALITILGCKGNSSPTEPSAADLPHGRLSGVVTIGPNCPGPTTGTADCPTPPFAYEQRKILVYDEPKTRVLFTVDIDSRGLYTILLIPATYNLELKGTGADKTSDLPVQVTIRANVATVVNVNVDTGLR